MRVMPFSMKTPNQMRTAPMFRVMTFLRVAGIRNSRKATTLKMMDNQPKRTMSLFPLLRYKVFKMHQVFRVGIDLLEHFGSEKEEVDEHGIGHELCDLPDGFVLDLEGCRLLQDLKENDQDGRAGTEGRCQKLGGQEGAIPVGTSGKSVVEEGGHGVDADGHRNGEEDQGRQYTVVVLLFIEECVEQIAHNDQLRMK